MTERLAVKGKLTDDFLGHGDHFPNPGLGEMQSNAFYPSIKIASPGKVFFVAGKLRKNQAR